MGGLRKSKGIEGHPLDFYIEFAARPAQHFVTSDLDALEAP